MVAEPRAVLNRGVKCNRPGADQSEMIGARLTLVLMAVSLVLVGCSKSSEEPAATTVVSGRETATTDTAVTAATLASSTTTVVEVALTEWSVVPFAPIEPRPGQGRFHAVTAGVSRFYLAGWVYDQDREPVPRIWWSQNGPNWETIDLGVEPGWKATAVEEIDDVLYVGLSGPEGGMVATVGSDGSVTIMESTIDAPSQIGRASCRERV